jgi:hypothetical protein
MTAAHLEGDQHGPPAGGMHGQRRWQQSSRAPRLGSYQRGHDGCVAPVTNEHRALASSTLRYAATLLSEKGQPGSFWLTELADSFEWGNQDRVLRTWLTGRPAAVPSARQPGE